MHVASLPAPAGAPRASPLPVISNGAGRLFLPLSLLRMRRPADVRNLSWLGANCLLIALIRFVKWAWEVEWGVPFVFFTTYNAS